jgi:arginyl-tRNA synthetase
VRELKEQGVAVESEGAIAVFTRATPSPIIVEKSGDGGYGYATTDLAAIRFR